MKLIADSGSTKTDWILLDNKQEYRFKTEGINPLFLTQKTVLEDILQSFPQNKSLENVDTIHFYAAGCSTKERCHSIKHLLSQIFINAQIEAQSDLLAAARALFQKEKGLACILGTGSNSCVYDGVKIQDNVTSLGYILGDEGSGAHIGKLFLKALLNQELSTVIEQDFQETFALKAENIVQQIYTGSYPSRFLASFAPFVLKHIKDIAIHNLVKNSFDLFFKYQIQHYSCPNCPIAFVGSIAWHFQDILKEHLYQQGFTDIRFLKTPIEGIMHYHL